MVYTSRSTPSATLPGPVTAPTSNLPNAASPILLQQLSPTSTVTTSTFSHDAFSFPYKTEGYQAFSAWMASEDDFFIIRRFDSLNARTLLWMQDHIVRIENKLNEIDTAIKKSDVGERRRNDSIRWDEKYEQQRYSLQEQLSSRLHDYNQFIDSYSKVRARPRADKHQIANVQNWLDRKAIAKDECSFIEHTGDLTSINHRSRPPLGRWLESIQQLHHTRFFRAKHLPNVHQTSAATSYSSNSRFDTFTNISIILGGLVMLLTPLWWLEYVNDHSKKLAIMTGFICVFIGLMSTATVNRPFEVVAATAAYAAVLMVFMQIDGKSVGS